MRLLGESQNCCPEVVIDKNPHWFCRCRSCSDQTDWAPGSGPAGHRELTPLELEVSAVTLWRTFSAETPYARPDSFLQEPPRSSTRQSRVSSALGHVHQWLTSSLCKNYAIPIAPSLLLSSFILSLGLASPSWLICFSSPGFEFQPTTHQPRTSPWACLSLSLLICKMGPLLHPTSQDLGRKQGSTQVESWAWSGA